MYWSMWFDGWAFILQREKVRAEFLDQLTWDIPGIFCLHGPVECLESAFTWSRMARLCDW
ncbi:hypothetical protein C5167_048309 [Papaver somniferum]|uniref:Uncharacterized protein n=1 Tax=Papaver somniferum TaxID=3469 RepID=A0A4Y7KKX6_PAPSO|nr:hypothetical protein C5167_048309 [Papaver somniferum]